MQPSPRQDHLTVGLNRLSKSSLCKRGRLSASPLFKPPSRRSFFILMKLTGKPLICVLSVLIVCLGLVAIVVLVQAQKVGQDNELLDAVQSGDTARVIALLAGGANPNARLSEAGITNPAKLLERFFLGAPASAVGPEGAGMTVLMWAVWHNHPAVVDAVLRGGADVHTRYKGGMTALMIAAYQGNPTVVASLLDNGSDVNAADNTGTTVLFYGIHARRRRPDMVSFLLRHGADVHARDNSGRTPLIVATQSGNEGRVQAILERGANVDVFDNSERTALHYARELRYSGIVSLLERERRKGRKPSALLNWRIYISRSTM